MMKVALRNAEYMANLPPYRFAPGDVIEVEDDWGEQLLRRGIAVKAKAGAKTAMELAVERRPVTPDDGGAAARADRRAALQAELDALDRVDDSRPMDGGHYSDMITREDTSDAAPARQPRRAASRRSAPKPDEADDAHGDDTAADDEE